MNVSAIRVVYGKELRDLIRDRRTMRAVVMPLVLIPLLMLGLNKVNRRLADRANAQASKIAILGGADCPEVVSLLRADQGLHVVACPSDWRDEIATKALQAVVRIPQGFDADLSRGAPSNVTLYQYEGEFSSAHAVNEVAGVLKGFGDSILRNRVARQGLPANFTQTFSTRQENVVSAERVAGNRVGGLLPYFIVMFSLLGAMYPAIDLTAGEKERGTLETMLATPAARTEIVLGKFLVVQTCCLAALALACLSFGLVSHSGGWGSASMANTGIRAFNALGIAGVLAMCVPSSILFSAILITVGTWSRGQREAMSLVGPLLLVLTLPALIGSMPGMELNARLAVVPILNLALGCREMLSGIWHWSYLALIFASMVLYAAVALTAAVRMFNRESVLFRV